MFSHCSISSQNKISEVAKKLIFFRCSRHWLAIWTLWINDWTIASVLMTWSNAKRSKVGTRLERIRICVRQFCVMRKTLLFWKQNTTNYFASICVRDIRKRFKRWFGKKITIAKCLWQVEKKVLSARNDFFNIEVSASKWFQV